MLHHTVSQPGYAKKVIDEWNNRSNSSVATHFVLDVDGTFYQTIPLDGYYAYHVGIKHPNNFKLTQSAIGIEIVNWGGLTNRVGELFNAYGQSVGSVNDSDKISFKNGYRGYYFFQKYTDAQVDALRQMMLFLNDKYGIPLDYNSDMFDVSPKALAVTPGIWSHTSVKGEKSDIFPQPEVIGMLKSLKNG
jgi:N-acetyl-anhydromuramyl-L-alanine amidase AmpD